MLRNANKTSTSMQKTYDECYLICSTAVYFEGQNNEDEALRSWRSALDRIYYHNAYKVAPNYHPASATEKALQDSLREMELQCKERVTLLEALKKSREEIAENGNERLRADAIRDPRPQVDAPSAQRIEQQKVPGWIGNGTVPPVSYNDIPNPAQPVNSRPNLAKSRSSETSQLLWDTSRPPVERLSSHLSPAAASSDAQTSPSRTPSPEKKTTMLRSTLRADKAARTSTRPVRDTLRPKPPTAGLRAAGMAWDAISKPASRPESRSGQYKSSVDTIRRPSAESIKRAGVVARPLSPPTPPTVQSHQKSQSFVNAAHGTAQHNSPLTRSQKPGYAAQEVLLGQRGLQASRQSQNSGSESHSLRPVAYTKPPADFLKYRGEYPTPEPVTQAAISAAVNPPRDSSADDLPGTGNPLPLRSKRPPPPPVSRRPITKTPAKKPLKHEAGLSPPNHSEATMTRAMETGSESKLPAMHTKRAPQAGTEIATPSSSESEAGVAEPSLDSSDWHERVAYIKKHLPKGVDEAAAKSIFNEIVVDGDEVHWDDVAGLDAAKTALKEAVVYPFLRPDLFLGLREPARGMLLFGPPGTGKTMLARAVATESRSTFFAISASSLTSKWMGESEKLVRALFQLAKALAPSIIFVDEIDSLLSSRGDGEHETTRRIKTEFLIQWSDLQRAAAGKEAKSGEGDATRVLVLAATNLPWAIDEAARRRFVRRQYIPLPEPQVREQQMQTLLGHQKHTLSKNDLKVLIELTDGYSGSDITALAKDAAMGPLRSLGESLLRMSPDEIRPITFDDFEASLVNIRPSVSKQGLKEFEDWAREFGERGG